MITLPAVPCINCQAEEVKVAAAQRQHDEGRDPPLWIATTYHVVCAQCGHRFQLAVIREAQ